MTPGLWCIAAAFLLPFAAVVGLAAARGLILAGRWALARLRTAADDQAVGEAPPLPGPVEAPAAITRWSDPRDRALFAERYAAIADDLAADFAHIDIEQLAELYIAPEVHQ